MQRKYSQIKEMPHSSHQHPIQHTKNKKNRQPKNIMQG